MALLWGCGDVQVGVCSLHVSLAIGTKECSSSGFFSEAVLVLIVEMVTLL